MSWLSIGLDALKKTVTGALPSIHQAVDATIHKAIDDGVAAVEAQMPAPNVLAEQIISSAPVQDDITHLIATLKAALPAEVQALPEVAAVLGETPAQLKVLLATALTQAEAELKTLLEKAADKVTSNL
jgi:hypothetical protein